MANTFSVGDIEAPATFTTELGGAFVPQASAAPIQMAFVATGALAATPPIGQGTWSVVQSGVGKFVLTINGPVASILGVRASVQQLAPSGLQAIIGPISGHTIEIDVVNPTTGALTNIVPSGMANSVHWHLTQALGKQGIVNG